MAKNVLVDQLEARSFPSHVNAFNLGSDVANLLSDMSIAIVCSDDVLENVRFFEKVAQVRGGNMKVFNNKRAALLWISHQ